MYQQQLPTQSLKYKQRVSENISKAKREKVGRKEDKKVCICTTYLLSSKKLMQIIEFIIVQEMVVDKVYNGSAWHAL